MSTDTTRRGFFGVAGGLAAGAALAAFAPQPAVPQALCGPPFRFVDGVPYCETRFALTPGRAEDTDTALSGER